MTVSRVYDRDSLSNKGVRSKYNIPAMKQCYMSEGCLKSCET